MSLLEVSQLSRAFGGLRAVDGVGFGAVEGRITAVIGPNGAGKTTLFNLIAGTLTPDSGTVSFDGVDITGMKPHRVARKGIARTFQAIKLSRKMTALENVMIGRHVRSRAGFVSGIVEKKSVFESVRFANAVAAAKVLRKGAQSLPSRRFIEKKFKI